MIIDFSPELQFGDGSIWDGQIPFGMYTRGSAFTRLSDRCTPWIGVATDAIWDSAYKAAVIFAFFANISVILGFSMSIFLVCCPPRQGPIQLTGLLFGLGFLWHVLMFVAFAYDVCNSRTCTFSSAAGVNVVATFMMIVTTIVVLKIQPRDVQDPPVRVAIPHNPKTTHIQETVHADGTKTIRKESTNDDGSTVVEETKIEVKVIDP
jgi:hypothetical protein